MVNKPPAVPLAASIKYVISDPGGHFQVLAPRWGDICGMIMGSAVAKVPDLSC